MLELAPISDNFMSYDEAVMYCQFLEYGGHRDWRLPTIKEWETHSISALAWWLNDLVTKSAKVVPVRDVC